MSPDADHASAASLPPASDAEWRRRLFGLADDEGDDATQPAKTQERRSRGLRARAAQRLDEYVATTAAELDERGETLRQQSVELEREAERIATAQSALDQRARRIHELGIADEEATRQLDRLVEVVAERDAQIAEVTKDRDIARGELALVRQKLASSGTEFTERQRLLAEREEHVAQLEQVIATQTADLAQARALLDEYAARASELKRDLAERERELSAVSRRSSGDADTAVGGSEARLEQGSSTHLLFVPGPGCYALIERLGPPPQVGQTITPGDGDDRRFVVARIGESPLPLDQRECAYLQLSA